MTCLNCFEDLSTKMVSMGARKICAYVLCPLIIMYFCLVLFNKEISKKNNKYFYSNVSSKFRAQIPITEILILYYGLWLNGLWKDRIIDQDELKAVGCPYFNCKFTYDQKYFHKADAVIFPLYETVHAYLLTRKNPSQRWIYANVEPPTFAKLGVHDYNNNFDAAGNSSVFNWTMTYHSSSEVVLPYGLFLPIVSDIERSIRPHLLDYRSQTMKSYLDAYNNGATGPMGFHANRSKLAAWMSSHCQTESRREQIITKLQKLIKIDTFGKCGKQKCFPRLDDRCWDQVLAPNYLFFFSMEHALCEEYVSEKAYYPYKYGLVPIVYGNANYSKILPPHSYIDIGDHTPHSLANLLIKLQHDAVAYGRYHLWRKFWKVYIGSSGCELCYQLNINKEPKMYGNVVEKRLQEEKCVPPSPQASFFRKK